MTITLVDVLREYEIYDRSTPGRETLVFDSQLYDADDQLTTFTRYIPDSSDGWIETVVRMNDTEVIGSGEDPRPFFWRGSVCVASQTFNPAHAFVNKFYIKNEDRWITLIPPTRITPGKNWAPFVRDGDLYFVHEYSPFRVMKAKFIHPRDDFMVLDIIAEHDIPTAKSIDGYSSFRGGSNGVQIGEVILGIGHTNTHSDDTIESIQHRPFVWVYHPDQSLTYYELDFDFPDTYRIVDPTSLYFRDGTLYMTTSETEFIWPVTGQKGRTCLYSLNLTGASHENGFGLGRRRLHWWPHDAPPKKRWFLGAWGRSKGA